MPGETCYLLSEKVSGVEYLSKAGWPAGGGTEMGLKGKSSVPEKAQVGILLHESQVTRSSHRG